MCVAFEMYYVSHAIVSYIYGALLCIYIYIYIKLVILRVRRIRI